jgi:POT family proton-dependent oligopeptide transporter
MENIKAMNKSFAAYHSAERIAKYPNFLKLLFFVEMWERFSYYGMRALLVLFLTSKLGFTDANAYAIYSLFAAIGYAGPVLGGIIADKIMGFCNMILIGGIIMAIGSIILTMSGIYPDLIYTGLGFVAVGTGFFKGNITNLLGASYKVDDENKSRGFTLFYVGINLGSFLASISCGYVANLYGWNYGFGLSAIGMIIGLTTFTKFQSLLNGNGAQPSGILEGKKTLLGLNPFSIVFLGAIALSLIASQMLMNSAFFANIIGIISIIVFGGFAYKVSQYTKDHRENLIALSIMIFFLMCFFGLEMQLGSLINLFTERNVVKEVFGIHIPASISQAINPLSIIVIGFIMGNYIKVSKKYSALVFFIGLIFSAICFFILYLGCINAGADGKVAYSYLLAAIFAMSAGEIFISPLVFSKATSLAPKDAKGLVMGILLLSLTFSNLAGILISKFMSVPTNNSGIVDSLESLAIYRDGFLNIAFFNIFIAISFLFCFRFLHRILTR